MQAAAEPFISNRCVLAIGVLILFILLGFLGGNLLGGRETFRTGSEPDSNANANTNTSANSSANSDSRSIRSTIVQSGGYPFAFLDQLDTTRSPYAKPPNTWPKKRSCDLEWNRKEPADPCQRLDLPTYFGSGIPIKTDEVCTRETDGESMFYFKNFRCSPDCCPSPYSCDGGCVCAFEKKVCQKWPLDLSKDPQRITF